MIARFRSWRQQIKQHRVTILIVAIILVVVIALIVVGYWFDWTGFNGYNQVTITRTLSGTNAGTITRTEVYQQGKTLWDWLGLLGVLAIPVVVGFGVALFTAQQARESEANRTKRHQTDLEIAEKNRELQQKTDLEIAAENRREVALQVYIDKISELLLKEHLGERTEGGELKQNTSMYEI